MACHRSAARQKADKGRLQLTFRGGVDARCGTGNSGSETKLGSLLRRRRQRSFALDYGLLPGVFHSPSFGGIKFYVRLKFSRNVSFGVNGFHRTFGDASGAIKQSSVWMIN